MATARQRVLRHGLGWNGVEGHMLLFYLLAAVAVGVLAAAAGLRAGFPGWAVLGCYLLGGAGALAISAVIDRWVERTRARHSGPRTSERGARRRGAILFLLVSLLALAVALLASAMGLIPGRVAERPAVLNGLLQSTLSPDHLLAVLWLGLWAGRIRGTALWALPTAFLGGTVAGFGLALGPPVGLWLDASVHLLIVASLLLLIGAALVPLRLSLQEAVSMVALTGACHGYVHGLEVDRAPVLWFGLGALIGAAALTAIGAALGRVVDRPV